MPCTKQLSFAEPPASNVELLAYYKLEEATGGNTVVDSHSTNNATTGYASINSVAGHIGNGIRVRTGGASETYVAPINTDFNGASFTVRFWMYQAEPRLTSGGSGVYVDGRWSLKTATKGYRIGVNGAMTSTFNYLAIPNVAAGWHRVIGWFDAATNTIGLQIDNNAPVTSSPGEGMKTYASCRPVIEATTIEAVTSYIDEVAIWEGVMSAAERLSDWNGGVGKTYPDVPGV